MSNRVTAIFYCIVGVIYFLIFAMDIEIDKDFFTWVWLLSAQLNFMASMRYFIMHDREKSKNGKITG
jgi:hypothetical protein